MSKPLDIRLLHGTFSTDDALELITQMIHIKIKYHEERIDQDSSEEDIKSRESKIKQLQKDLFELREGMAAHRKTVKLDAVIHIS